jgi:hypothetical protein
MFVRFQARRSRLLISLAQSHRTEGGKVRQEHVAGLGSIEATPSVADRLAFWKQLHERLARLSNRIDGTMQAEILGKVHERVPMVTPDEQRNLQLENAKADERLWSILQDAQAEAATGYKGASADTERKAMAAQVNATEAASKVAAARERIAKIEKGDDVQGGLGKQVTLEQLEAIIREQGGDPDHIRAVHEISRRGLFEEYIAAVIAASSRFGDRIEKRIARKMLKSKPLSPG